MAWPLSETGSLPTPSVSGHLVRQDQPRQFLLISSPGSFSCHGGLTLEIWEATEAHPLSGDPAPKRERLP